MNGQSRYAMFAMTILTVFALSAFRTVPAYADDSTPPPTETPTVETLPTEVLIEAAPTVEEVSPTETPIMEETVAELLAQVPEGTDVVVVNGADETVPLVTQEAADAIEHGDPVWCPTGVAPKTDGTGGCTTSYGNLKLLVDNLMAGTAGVVPAKNGVIWIQSGGDLSSGAILLDGNDPQLGTMETFSLTLQGGWNGAHGSSSVSLLTPSTFTQSLSITNWLGDITLNNITFSGVTVGSASNNAALNVQTSKKITLTNVKVNANSGAGTVNGAYLNNADADPLVFGNVSIISSTFNDNKNKGLQVFSEGTITLANVLVNGNDAGGATLNNSTAVTAKAVTITTGTNEFSNNLGGDGLNISSKGAITLKDITANHNGDDGVFADNHLAGTAQVVTLSGTNVFSENTNNGLVVKSRGAISVSNLVANNNRNGWGADLNNTFATTALPVNVTGINEFKFNGGGMRIQSQGAITTNKITALADPNVYTGNSEGVYLQNNYNFNSNVTMNGTNVITGNYHTGLAVYSKGSITLNNVTATGNGGCGVYLNNTASVTPMAVTLNGINTFNDNLMTGLEIHTNGTVTLSKITANHNGKSGSGYGALIHNELTALPKAVTLNGYGIFYYNSLGGLEIITKGAITLNNVTANDNHGDVGVNLDNTASSFALPQNVTLNGTNEFYNNYASGLDVNTFGAILVNNINADHNGYGLGPNGWYGYGVSLDNCQWNVSVCNAVSPKSVILTGYGSFINNVSGGLKIITKGAITLNNVTANDNIEGNGVQLDNTANSPALPQNVTINGTNGFSGNYSSGLEVKTYGAILINNVTASDNGQTPRPDTDNYGYGANLDNCQWNMSVCNAFSPKSVTVTGYGIFNNNFSGGLKIITKGAITLNNVTANNNGSNLNTAVGIGVQLDNISSTSALPQNVTINGTNSFSGNYSSGLDVNTFGAILMNNVTASDNGGTFGYGYGANLDNCQWNGNGSACDAVSPKSITLTGYGIFNQNYTGGLNIITKGVITLNNITANNNTFGFGVQLENIVSTSALPQNVTINGTNEFSGNGDRGLILNTFGAILINNITANDNHGLGADLNNSNPDSSKSVTLTGYGIFNYNSYGGLSIITSGAIKANQLEASYDNHDGIHLVNNGTGATGGVTITGWVYVEDDANGLYVLSNGAINIANLNVKSPGLATDIVGAILDNSTGSGNITISGTNQIFDCENHGLIIETNGSVTLSNMTVSGNGIYGVLIGDDSKPQNVTLTGLNYFYNNGLLGLEISAHGAITLSNLDVYGNGQYGVWLENCGYDTSDQDACAADWSAPKGITITGTNFFVNNDSDGLWAASKGAITISNITANWNSGNGATLNNQWGTGSVGGITLTGLNIFNDNEQKGLVVNSQGAITISNLLADWNYNDGVVLNNRSVTGTTGAAVTLTGVNTFTNNGNGIQPTGGHGLVILSNGQITLSNVTATGNVGKGVSLVNDSSMSAIYPGIKLTGVNTFSRNVVYGLSLWTYGVVDLVNVTADLNGLDGLNAGTSGKFTLACASLNNNGENGWDVTADGIITLKGVFGSGNTSGNFTSTTPVIVRACPAPAPVVIQPEEDEDRAAGGAEDKPDLVYERK